MLRTVKGTQSFMPVIFRERLSSIWSSVWVILNVKRPGFHFCVMTVLSCQFVVFVDFKRLYSSYQSFSD